MANTNPNKTVLAIIALIVILTIVVGLVRRRRWKIGAGTKSSPYPSSADSETAKGPWPSCVGMSGTWCKEHILSLDSSVKVYILDDGSIVTDDWVTGRVRIYIDGDGNVVRSPKRG